LKFERLQQSNQAISSDNDEMRELRQQLADYQRVIKLESKHQALERHREEERAYRQQLIKDVEADYRRVCVQLLQQPQQLDANGNVEDKETPLLREQVTRMKQDMKDLLTFVTEERTLRNGLMEELDSSMFECQDHLKRVTEKLAVREGEVQRLSGETVQLRDLVEHLTRDKDELTTQRDRIITELQQVQQSVTDIESHQKKEVDFLAVMEELQSVKQQLEDSQYETKEVARFASEYKRAATEKVDILKQNVAKCEAEIRVLDEVIDQAYLFLSKYSDEFQGNEEYAAIMDTLKSPDDQAETSAELL
jgi:chromosome segregation ATPase